jgi:hypothetical protein
MHAAMNSAFPANRPEATTERSAATRLRTFLAAASLGLLCGCGGGGPGNQITIGSGQDMDPTTVDAPIFYVKRPVTDADDDIIENDVRELLRFDIGADLFTRSSASPSTVEVNLTSAQTQGLGDVRDLDVNFDGTKLVFAMRARFIENADEEDQPTWNIWEYDTVSKMLRRVIVSDTIAEEGHDIMPAYLPDGRIVFSSTRQRQAKATQLDESNLGGQFTAQDEDDNEPAFVLHVMDANGENIHQISFNQSHDLEPSVLPSGQVVFSRWEHAPGATAAGQFDLYKMNPDGSGLELLYGANSHQSGSVNPANGNPTTIQFLAPRPMADGRMLAILRPFIGTNEGGEPVMIDTGTYVDNTQPLAASAGMPGPAQVRTFGVDIRTLADSPSPGGRYRTAVPLFDGTGRILVTWSLCRLLEGTRIVPCTSDRLGRPDAMEAPPLYALYIYDPRDNTQRPIIAPTEGVAYTDIVGGAPRPLPPVILDRAAGVDFPQPLLTESVGILHIRSVYDFDGADTAPGGIATVRNPANAGFATRPSRFLRIEKAVSQPDEDLRDVSNSAFGPNGRRFGMRTILGYAPVEPDGSVKVKVPANVAFMISVVDANGRRVGPRHSNWMQLQPGETVECNGCHSPTATTPGTPARSHGRTGLFASINSGAPTSGAAFPNTNQALFADMGETMAQVRGRIMCAGACEPSVDVIYEDYWSITPSAAFDMCYSTAGLSNVLRNPADLSQRHQCQTGLTTVIPTTQQCANDWNNRCRITIHYEQHLHALWNLNRQVLDPNDASIVLADNTCTRCHSTVDPANAAAMQVPAGQLDLTDGASDDNADQFKAYRELLFSDTELELNGGTLVERMVQIGVDPVTGQPQFAPVNVSASMSAAAGARTSRFFVKFDNGAGSVNHRGFLTLAELRLLAEWLDIGAQYFNDPFVAPEN